MSYLAESWGPVARTLGYANEREMLVDLYTAQGWSLEIIATALGFARANVRKRLLEHGVKLRGRGGRNALGHRKLAALSDAALSESIFKIAAVHNCHVSTVLLERKRRKQWSSALSPPPPTSNASPEDGNAT